VFADLLTGRSFEFSVERAVFATVLHRIMVSGVFRRGIGTPLAG